MEGEEVEMREEGRERERDTSILSWEPAYFKNVLSSLLVSILALGSSACCAWGESKKPPTAIEGEKEDEK